MPRAEADLNDIQSHFADAPGYAKRIADELFKVTRRLEAFPRSGRVVPEVGRDAIREVVHRRYRVVYVVTSDDAEVDVLTVFHSSRPLGNALGAG